MINRFRTRCTTCGHFNTLRITLGTEQRQEHTFSCVGCGLPSRVALDINFKDRLPIGNFTDDLPEKMRGVFTQPTVTFHTLENCESCEEEGAITNLDPNFLVPRELLHTDNVFSWMYEAQRIGTVDDFELRSAPAVNDIIHGLGGIRELKHGISTLCRAWSLHKTGKAELRDKIIGKFCAEVKITETLDVYQFAALCASQFFGRTRSDEITDMLTEASLCANTNPAEYYEMREWSRKHFDETFARQIGTLEEYAKAYDQLSQALIYAIRNVPISGKIVASSRDLQAVRMFYGNCFENLASGFDLPACLNNIRAGRSYDQFKSMTLKQYLTINKAGRAKPFSGNAGFSILHDEFNSTIRNASHHGALRLCSTQADLLEYRSGDGGNWNRMPFAEYLLRCNRIMMCAMRLLILQVHVLR